MNANFFPDSQLLETQLQYYVRGDESRRAQNAIIQFAISLKVQKRNLFTTHLNVGLRYVFVCLCGIASAFQGTCIKRNKTAYCRLLSSQWLMFELICTPHQVNTPVEGKGPLHIAITEGYSPTIVNAILRFHPDLEMEVSICDSLR